MKDEQILERAIKKAVNNGFSFADLLKRYNDTLVLTEIALSEKETTYDTILKLKEVVIYSHDFAKAFWGEKEIEIEVVEEFLGKKNDDHIYYLQKAWRYHLTQMVLEKDPIKYLKKFLD